MNDVPDDTKLSKLSIPGTHSSMTSASRLCQDKPYFKCLTQQLTLEEQLRARIRFIDIQVSQSEAHPKQFQIYHGTTDLGVTLRMVFGKLKEFLALQPSETILLNVRQVDEESIKDWDDLRKTIDAYMTIYPKLFYQENYANSRNRTPTLKMVRGKIVMLNSFSNFDEVTTRNRVNAWLGSRAFTTGLHNEENTVIDVDGGLMVDEGEPISCDIDKFQIERNE